MDIKASDNDKTAIVAFNTYTLTSSYTMALSSSIPVAEPWAGW
jgi:hypothetical protein